MCRNLAFLEWLSSGARERDGSDIKFSHVGEIENEILHISECDTPPTSEC